jgi:glycosyltransferase involved in cell wall biosynthesis
MIMVRDLPLGPTAYWAGELAGLPVVMDMAENYPAMIADTWRYGRVGPLDPLIRNPRLLRGLEAWTLPRMGGVIAVSEPSANRVRRHVSTDTHVWTVGNTPVLRTNTASDETSDLARLMASTKGLRLLYVGGLEESRGLEVVIRALPIAQGRIGSASLFVVGEGSSQRLLERVATELGVAGSTHFAGWVEPGKLPAVTANADICLVPHYVTEHIDTTIPNKIFDYMYAGKPVIVTHSKTLRQIVESKSCGKWYQDDRPEQLADRIAALRIEGVRAEMGARGRQAVLEEFNWRVDEGHLFAGLQHVHDRYFGSSSRP